ncbi:MAG: hypothetical protein AB1465_06810 [Patescibacteria group bacterium]
MDSEILPTLMQNVGLALLTILIPLVLFIFSLEKEALFEWDKIVILDKVIEAKNLFASIVLIFSPLFFWNYNSSFLKFILFLIFLGGVIYLIKILFNSYRWIKTVEIQGAHDPSNFRDSLRNKYLEEIDNLPEKEKIWILTWRKDISNTIYERSLIKKFTANIDALIRNKNFELLQRYLQNFFAFIDKRALYDWVIFGDFFRKILEWYFAICIEREAQKDEDTPKVIAFFETESILSRLIEKFVLSALQKGTAYLLFEELKKNIKDKNTKCIEQLFARSVCRVLFDNIADSQERYDIWEHYFPNEWKITKETLEDKSNTISKIWLNQFFHWAQGRIWEAKKDFDKNLDNVASELFPSVEPILWAKILTLLMRPWTDNNRMKSLVERGTNFGFASRIMLGDFESAEQSSEQLHKYMKSQEEATLQLALLLFKHEFTKEKLQGYIDNLKELKYNEGTREEARRNDFIAIFEKMISLLEPKKS